MSHENSLIIVDLLKREKLHIYISIYIYIYLYFWYVSQNEEKFVSQYKGSWFMTQRTRESRQETNE